jgi:hypothetical protein
MKAFSYRLNPHASREDQIAKLQIQGISALLAKDPNGAYTSYEQAYKIWPE